MRRHRPSARRGLTLIELMVVISLLAFTASLAVPELGRQVARWKMQAVAERLAHDLASARFAAVQKRSAHYVRVSAGRTWCWSVSTSPNCPCDAEQHCQAQRVAAPRHNPIELVRSATIRFDPTADAHRTQAEPLTVRNPQGDELRVQLTPLGRAKICAPEGARWGYAAC